MSVFLTLYKLHMAITVIKCPKQKIPKISVFVDARKNQSQRSHFRTRIIFNYYSDLPD